RWMMRGGGERVGHGGTDPTAARLQRQGGQQRPAVVREVPEPVAVGHTRVAEGVGGGPVAPQRRDVRAPRLHADRDHAARIVDGATGCQRARVRPMLARLVALAVLSTAVATGALGQTPVEAARALVAQYHEDPAKIDRARDMLEAALAKDRQVETMIMLSYVQFLWGDIRAKTDDEKLAACDRARAEEHFKKGLAIDPRFTVLRVDLARLYIATARYAEARQELTRVLDERAPRIVADWTVKDAPRARTLLESIKDKR